MRQYDWDEKKATSNQKKHGVSFDEAITALQSQSLLVFEDLAHSEERFVAIGFSVLARILVVVYCYRHEDTVRIISARKATRKEHNFMKKEYDFSKMKRVQKGPVLDPKATKVQVGMRLDGDVLQWAMAEGERLGLGYQTFLNMKMRESMQTGSLVDRVERLERKLKPKPKLKKAR